MFKNLRKIVLGLLAVCLTGALGAGVAFGVEAHAEETVASVKAFKTTQINLNESITVRYNLTVPAGYTGAEITFTVGEGGSPITAEPKIGLTDGQDITFELKNIGPQNMADKITATVTFTGENGETGVETCETSVKEYCQTLLKNAAAGKADGIDAQEKFDALKTLASSLLVYGDEAQKYVGKEASSTTGLTVAQKNAALKAQASSSDLSFSGEAYKGLLWSGATLWFGNKVNLIYYFKADSALQAQGTLGVKAGESFFEAQAGETVDGYTEYSATYEGLSVTEFDSVIGARVAYKTTDGVVTEVGKTANYSVKSYVLRAPEPDKALAEAAYSYGVAAKAYTEALGNTTIVDYNGETVSITNTADVSSFNNYVRDVATYGFEQKYNLSYVNKAGIGSTFIHTGVTDGTYIYYLTCASGKAENKSRSYTILKYDLASGTVVGKSAAFSARKGSGEWNSDTYLIAYYKDGAIYVFDINDNLLSISVDDFKEDGSVAPAAVENAPEFTLTNVSGMAYKDGKYATIDSNGVLKIYKENNLTTAISSTQCANVSGGGSAKRLTASGNYLYALSLANGVITPKVTVVDWYGVKIAELTIPVTKELIGIPETIEVTKNGETKTVTTTEFNVQNFVVIGDKAYAMMYCGVEGYSRTPFITVAPVEQQETKEVYLNYGLAERAEKGLNTTVETTLAKGYGTGLGANFVYASTTDGTYAYFLAGSAAKDVTITKYDVVSNTKIATSASIGGVTEASVYMFVKDNFVYAYSAEQNKTFCLPANFSGGTTATEVTFNFDGVSGTIKGVYYSNARKQYAVLAGNNVYVCGEDLVAKYYFAVPSSHAVTKYDGTTATASEKNLFGEDEYIYLNYWTQGGVTPAIVAYTFDGCKLYDGIIENAVHEKTNNEFKLESALVIDGNLYFTILTWTTGASGSALFKTSFTSTKEEKIIVSAGEYYEEVGSLAFADTDIKTVKDNKLSGTNSHGLTVDGIYGYISSTTTKFVDDLDADGNQQIGEDGKVKQKVVLDSVYVTKFYLATGQSVGYAKIPLSTRTNAYANNDYLFIKDGYVYSVSDGKVYRGKTDIFTPNGGEMEYVENFFSVAVDVATYSSEKDCFAARKGNSLYVGKYDEEAGKVVLEQLAGVWTDGLLGMNADENYIYLLKEVQNNASACVSIYDWNGNAVVRDYQVSLIADSGVKNNVQSISFANGKVHFLVCCWGGVAGVLNGGANVVSGYLDTSKIA